MLILTLIIIDAAIRVVAASLSNPQLSQLDRTFYWFLLESAGGAGRDTFYFASKDIAGFVDHITDFKHGTDLLDLQHVAKTHSVDAVVSTFTLSDKADGTHIGFGGHDFLVLDGVHHLTLASLAADSMVL